MTLIPRTLSREVRSALGHNNFTEESLFQKLSPNPKILLQFFIQAVQSHTWCVNNKSLVHRMFSEIYKKIISDEIPFDHAMRTCAYVIKYNLFAFNLCSYEREKNSYSGIGMLWAVPKMLETLREIEVNEKKLIAPHVDVREFRTIYSTFNLQDFCVFHSFPIKSLRGCLLQCKVWDYKEGVLELQKIYISRIFNIIDAYEVYGFSFLHKFTLLKCFCEKIISNYEGVGYLLQGTPIFTCVRKVYPQTTLNMGSISYTELAKHRHSIEKSGMCDPGATYERLDVGIVATGMVSIALKKMDAGQYVYYSGIKKDKSVRFNFSDITSVTFDRGTLITNEFLVGFCAFFPNICDISFKSGNEIDKQLLTDVSLVAPKLKSFVIYEVKNVDKNALLAISTALFGLEELSFALIEQLGSFEHLDLPRLNKLTIEACSEIKGENLNSRFPNLRELKIQSLEWKNVKKLVETCSKVEVVTIRAVDGFELSHYPYPQSIVELNIDSKTLALSVVNSTIPCLQAFSRLKTIVVIGMPDAMLRRAIESFPINIKIKIVKFI